MITALTWAVLFTIPALAVDGLSRVLQAEIFLLEAATIYLSLFTVWRVKKPVPEEIEAASRDELTGLASRAALMRAVHDAIAASTKRNNFIAVLFLDFDNFKRLNDTLGHAAGDRHHDRGFAPAEPNRAARRTLLRALEVMSLRFFFGT